MRCSISHLSTLYRYLKGCRSSYLAGFFLLAATNGFGLAIPWLLKLAIEEFRSGGHASHTPAYYALLIAFAAILQGVIRIFSRTTFLNAGRRIEFLIREELYAKLLELDQAFFSRERTGDILSRFSNDLTNVRMLAGFGVLNIFNTVILYVAAILLMVRISPLLTLLALLPYPLMILVIQRISRNIFNVSREAQESVARLSTRAEENISAATVIKAYCRQYAEMARFKEASLQYQSANMKMANLRGAMIPIMGSVSGIGTLIVLFVGGSWIISGRITLGDFVAFSGYLAMLIWPTVVMGWILNLVQRGAASMGRLNYVLIAAPTVTDPVEPTSVTPAGSSIEFRELSFIYPDGKRALQKISLQVQKGMKIGIAGPIGSGKSTLVRLICRLHAVPEGQLLVDGIDINRISLKDLRSILGYVPQESFLFSRTIRENISFGLNGATADEISAAARIANLQKDIDVFPSGFETLVGERGLTLSGGQKQRVAIARALLKQPSILILDDPLSAVDAGTEAGILKELTEYFADKTVFIISHRLSALRDCDLILVLDNGQIVERGTHDELMAFRGRYETMHREQRLREEIEEY